MFLARRDFKDGKAAQTASMAKGRAEVKWLWLELISTVVNCNNVVPVRSQAMRDQR